MIIYDYSLLTIPGMDLSFNAPLAAIFHEIFESLWLIHVTNWRLISNDHRTSSVTVLGEEMGVTIAAASQMSERTVQATRTTESSYK